MLKADRTDKTARREALHKLELIWNGGYSAAHLKYDYGQARNLVGIGTRAPIDAEWLLDLSRPLDPKHPAPEDNPYVEAALWLRRNARCLAKSSKKDSGLPGLVLNPDAQSANLIADLIKDGRVENLDAAELTKLLLRGQRSTSVYNLWGMINSHAEARITPLLFAKWQLGWLASFIADSPRRWLIRKCARAGCNKRFFKSGRQSYHSENCRQSATNTIAKPRQKQLVYQRRRLETSLRLQCAHKFIARYESLRPKQQWTQWVAQRAAVEFHKLICKRSTPTRGRPRSAAVRGITPKFLTRAVNEHKLKPPKGA